MRPASEMYRGQQHVRLMGGVKAFRTAGNRSDEVNLQILSAGYGLISEDRMVAPYECTFQGMRLGELQSMAETLRVPEAFRAAVRGRYDLGVVLLGESYLEACQLNEDVEFGGTTLLFCSTAMARRLPRMRNVKVVALAPEDTRRFSAGLVALKGELASRLLARAVGDPSLATRLTRPDVDVLAVLEAAGRSSAMRTTAQTPSGVLAAKAASEKAALLHSGVGRFGGSQLRFRQ